MASGVPPFSKNALLCCQRVVACPTMPSLVIKKCCLHCHHSVQLLSVGLCALQAAKPEAPARHRRGRSALDGACLSTCYWTRGRAQAALNVRRASLVLMTCTPCKRPRTGLHCVGHALQTCACFKHPAAACIVPCAHQHLFVQRHCLSVVAPRSARASFQQLGSHWSAHPALLL